HRWPLKTPYPQIVEDVRTTFANPKLRHSALYVDATGVGRSVVDLFRSAELLADLRPYTITAGFRPGPGTVPKQDLVAAVQAVLGTRRLKFAAGLALADVIKKELEHFRSKVTPDRDERFASWRERDHDDCVLALALAVWGAQKDGVPDDYTPTAR